MLALPLGGFVEAEVFLDRLRRTPGAGEGARLGLMAFWLASGQWPDCADEVPYDFRRECGRVQGVPEEGFGF